MRIAVDGVPLLGEAGIATFLRQLLLHLAREPGPHQYRLVFRAFRAETRRRVTTLLADTTFDGVQGTVLPLPDTLLDWVWTDRSWHLPLTERWLGDPDLFLSTVYVTPVLRRARVVVIAYDLIPLRLPQLFGSQRGGESRRMRQSLARADAVLAISECTKRDFVELLGADAARIHVVYPGVNPGFQPAHHRATCQPVLRRLEVRTPYLLYVGSLGPHKNVGTLIRVFRRLKQARGIPHQLVLGGRIAWGPEVVAAAQDLAETGDCRILDFVSTADLPILYGAADAFVFLSLYEGFGLPPLEAMASGTPVVVSNAAALPEVAGDAALQVPPTDEAAIAEAILRVVGDADLRRELSVKGLRQAARFTWARTVRQTLQVFGSATGDLP